MHKLFFLIISSGFLSNVALAMYPLNQAAEAGNCEPVLALLNGGVNINQTDQNRETPLHKAARCGHIDVVQLLLDRGADVNIRNERGYSLLEQAIMDNQNSIVDLLLKHPKIVFSCGERLFYDTIRRGNYDMVSTLLQHGAGLYLKEHCTNNAVYTALKKGYPKIAELLLNQGADINFRPPYGEIPLINAVVKNNADIVEFLLDHGANTNVHSNNHETPLEIALHNDNTIITDLLLKHGAIKDFTKKQRQSLLLENVKTTKMFCLLIRNKQIISLKDKYWLHAFENYICNHWAISSLELVEGCEKQFQNLSSILYGKILIQAIKSDGVKLVERLLCKPNIDVTVDENAAILAACSLNDELFHTFLHHVKTEELDSALDEFIKKVGIQKALKLLQKWPELQKIRSKFLSKIFVQVAASGDVDLTQKLLNDPLIDINQQGLSDSTALMWAVKNNHENIVKLLLENRAIDVNASWYNITPIYYAYQERLYSIFRLLLEHNANVNIYFPADHPPLLSLAAQRSDIDGVKLLLAHGAYINEQQPFSKKTPLHYAIEANNYEIVRFLLEHGANIHKKYQREVSSPIKTARRAHHDIRVLLDTYKSNEHFTLGWAVKKNDIARIKILLKNSQTNPNHDSRKPPLHIAAKKGFIDAAILLLDRGANVNQIYIDGKTPLHYAAINGSPKMVVLLLDRGATVNQTDHAGKTPLHYAANAENRGFSELERDLTPVIILLIKAGTEIDQKDKDGCTPLFYAAQKNSPKIVAHLLKLGADINIQNNDGEFPLHVAAQNGHLQIVRLLLGIKIDFEEQETSLPANSSSWITHFLPTQLLRWLPGITIQTHNNMQHQLIHNEEKKITKISVDCQDRAGETPLYKATDYARSTEVVALLLSCGANPYKESRWNGTPLQIAQQKILGSTCTRAEEREIYNLLQEYSTLLERSTFCQVFHSRLGAHSPASVLPQLLLQEILQYVTPENYETAKMKLMNTNRNSTSASSCTADYW